ncbi:hypothetical protein SP15_246 [Bacillus phage SP-15]|uniref:Uncharacterized protein n=1 Tax=Bacillus phage SP-15 TaxID=1792032 RepID=A0A127AZ40_9CAUD|nr:hypothetical protein SP15_246 [Bacillus phage SP-15]AMM45051.1 hypothetical protein SP15_246 [Bacillus phage SP-15]
MGAIKLEDTKTVKVKAIGDFTYSITSIVRGEAVIQDFLITKGTTGTMTTEPTRKLITLDYPIEPLNNKEYSTSEMKLRRISCHTQLELDQWTTYTPKKYKDKDIEELMEEFEENGSCTHICPDCGDECLPVEIDSATAHCDNCGEAKQFEPVV